MVSSSGFPGSLRRAEWIRRCSLRIRALDDVVTLVDAADLATTLHDLPCCQELSPETAAARLFQDDLTPSQWNNDLSALCDRPRAGGRDGEANGLPAPLPPGVGQG